jgi:hypothetical protein
MHTLCLCLQLTCIDSCLRAQPNREWRHAALLRLAHQVDALDALLPLSGRIAVAAALPAWLIDCLLYASCSDTGSTEAPR